MAFDVAAAIAAAKELARLARSYFEGKRAKDHAFYEHVVEPLYRNCVVVYQNYLEILDRLIDRIETSNNSTGETARFLEKARIEFQPLRQEIRALSEVLAENGLVSDTTFDVGILGIMMSGAAIVSPDESDPEESDGDEALGAASLPRHHTILALLDELRRHASFDPSVRAHLATRVRGQRERLTEAFDQLSSGHAQLRASLMRLS